VSCFGLVIVLLELYKMCNICVECRVVPTGYVKNVFYCASIQQRLSG
jgi:hypothetical protein